MSSYAFRVRFLLPEGRAIEYDRDTLNIPLPLRDKKALLKSVSKRNIKDSNNLAIHVGGFASEKEALTEDVNVTCTFKNGQSLINFLLSKDRDILDALLNNEIILTGNLNYMFKFGFMAKHLYRSGRS